MTQIGDYVPKSGIYTKPGVVTEKGDSGRVKIDTEPMSINKYHRYSNTTGLSPEDKERFNAILDEIYANENPKARVEEIQSEIDKLEKDPSNGNVVQYLRNQQAIMIREVRSLPRYYTTEEGQLDY